MLPRIQPIAPKRIQAPFDHDDFVYEVKMDGWRCLAYIENGVCRLISRKQNQYKSFGPLAAVLAKLKVQNAIIDGEVVCLDAEGKSVFLDLMRPRKAHRFRRVNSHGPKALYMFFLRSKVALDTLTDYGRSPETCRPGTRG